MMDVVMTWLLRIFCYGFQLSVLFLIALALAVPLARGKRKAAAVLLAVFLTIECGLCDWLAFRPIVHVPEEYEPYVSREEVRSYNSGFYSVNIPIFPACIEVLRADEQETLVRTYYCFFGTQEMSITADGPEITKPLCPWS